MLISELQGIYRLKKQKESQSVKSVGLFPLLTYEVS